MLQVIMRIVRQHANIRVYEGEYNDRTMFTACRYQLKLGYMHKSTNSIFYYLFCSTKLYTAVMGKNGRTAVTKQITS